MATALTVPTAAVAARSAAIDSAWLQRVHASGILEREWLPAAARSWIETPPDGVLVAWFMSGDPDWGDVVAWKSAHVRARRVGPRIEPVQAYQDWPPRFGYWRLAAGDDRIARILYATYAAWNAAMRQFVKIERVSPAAAIDQIRAEHGDIFDLTHELGDALPGSAGRIPLRRRGFLTAPRGTVGPLGAGLSAATAPAVPDSRSRQERVRRLVVDYGPAMTSFCRRWGKAGS